MIFVTVSLVVWLFIIEEYKLAQVVSHMVCAADQHVELIAVWFFGKIFF